MKLNTMTFLGLLFLTLTSFAEQMKTEIIEYPLYHQCKLGEVAVAENNLATKGDGTFTVKVACNPADCFVSLPKNDGYTIKLIASRNSFVDLSAGKKISSGKIVTKIQSLDKSAVNAEVKELVKKGICKKAIFDSTWNHL